MNKENMQWNDLYDAIVGNAQAKITVLYHDELYGVRPRISWITNGDWIDMYTAVDVDLKAGEYGIISLGVSIKLPDGYEALLAPRSSTFKKYGIIQTNSIGVIDNSYCGEEDIWGFPYYATRSISIPKDTRICQFRIIRNQPNIVIEETAHLSSPNRGGFGSTGVK